MKKFEKTILIELHGQRTDFLRRLVKDEKLSNIQKVFLEKGNYFDIIGYVGGNPKSVSGAVLSGKRPTTLDIPLLPRFKSKQKTIEKEQANLIKTLKDLPDNLYTKFENPVNLYSVLPVENSNLGFFARQKRNWFVSYAKKHKHWEMVDRESTKTLVKLLNKNHDFYHLTYHALSKTYRKVEDNSKRIEFSLDLLDYNIGLIADALKAKGLYDKTLIVMIGNYSQAQGNNFYDLNKYLNQKGYKTTVPGSSIKPDHQLLCLQKDKSIAQLYIRPESGNWYEEGNPQQNLILKQELSDLLVEQPEVDQVIMRVDNDKVKIVAKWGASILSWHKDKIFYDVISGNDPFNLNNNKTVWNANESFDITWKSRYPDVIWQIRNMFSQPNMGDLVVSAKRGFIFSQKKKTQKRSHGSFNTDHMLLPLLINYKTKQRIRRATDVYRAISILQGFEEAPGKIRQREKRDDKRKKPGKRKYQGQQNIKRSGGTKPRNKNAYKKSRD